MSDVLSPYEKFKVKLLGAPIKVRHSCLLWHDWQTWAKANAEYIRSKDGTVHTVLFYQFRSCQTCNAMGFRQVRVKI